MLSLVKKRKLGAGAIPAHLTTLSVSWLNNQFKAVAVHRGTIIGTWERPGETDGPDRFDTFVREAGQHTGYKGQTVSLILSHPRLVQQLIEVPPVKGSALDKVIQRQAQQQKMFTGEAAWASQLSRSDKTVQRAVLHLFPKLLLNQFVNGCRRNGLYLTGVIPISAVLQHQLTQLGIEKDEIGLIAAETGGSTSMVAGTGDGKILLARTLSGNWNGELERMTVDLNRTVLFVNQQYGVTINKGIWLFGPGAEQQTDAVQNLVPMPVEDSPIEYDPFYWATETLKLRPELVPNLISREQRLAPKRRIFATVVGAATVIVVAGSLIGSSVVMRQAQQEASTVATVSRDLAKMQGTKTALEALDRELARKQQVIRLVIGERPPPTPAWFLAYLNEAVPSDLVVTNLQIARKEDYYTVLVAGTYQQTPLLGQPAPQQIADPVALLKARLASAPFHLRIAERPGELPPVAATPTQPKPAAPAETGIPAWLNRLTSATAARSLDNKPVRHDNFQIEGTMK